MKTFIINIETSRALRASRDRKWKRVYLGVGEDCGAENCALCELFDKKCRECPVGLDGHDRCRGTPYTEWERHQQRDHYVLSHRKRVAGCIRCEKLSFGEYDYLLGLEGRCTVIPGATNHVEINTKGTLRTPSEPLLTEQSQEEPPGIPSLSEALGDRILTLAACEKCGKVYADDVVGPGAVISPCCAGYCVERGL